jgi:hypothetical protein
VESDCERPAGLGSNSLGWKRIGLGGAEGSGGAEKNACGGKLSTGGEAGALALGRVPFWGDVRNGAVNVPRGTITAWRDWEGGRFFDVPRGTNCANMWRFGKSA